MGRVDPRKADPCPSPRDECGRERAIAGMRALLAVPLGVASAFAPMSPGAMAIVPLVLAVYGVVALATVAAVWLKRGRLDEIWLGAHATDILAATLLLLGGGNATGLVVSVAALLGLAHRWGFRGAMLGAAASIALLASFWTFRAPTVAPTFILEACGFVLLTAVLVGFLSLRTDDVHQETAVVARVMQQAEVRLGLKHTMAVMFDAVLEHFGGQRAVLIVDEVQSTRVFIWHGGGTHGRTDDMIRVRRLDRRELDIYRALPHAAAWSAFRHRVNPLPLDVVAVDANGARTDADGHAFSPAFLAAIGPFKHLMGLTVEHPEAWSARLYIVDPRLRFDRMADLGVGLRIARQLGRALDNVYLLHRLRSRSAANERARIARELHDGIIQSVVGVEIQLHALQERATARSKALGAEMERLGGVLRDEVLNLRDLMQQMKPLELSPDRLMDTLAEIVQRFQYETGVTTRFITQYDRIDLPPRACREVARIVQEALVNVRKHSGAHNVFVRLTLADGVCRLSIDDDGRGFPVIPRGGPGEVTPERQGPRVIRERVKLLGGEVAGESAPQQGARLHISIPLTNAHAIYG